jgi:hypothetical protein
MRLALSSFATNKVNDIDLVQWGDVIRDPLYLAQLKSIVEHIGTKPNVYVMITVFAHPSLDAHGLPTDATAPVYLKLAQTFLHFPQVLYGVSNEPHDAPNEEVWTAMNKAVEVFRSVEPADGPHHIIAVQGTQKYARELDYYLGRRIVAGGGKNVIYETHVYNHPSDWQALFIGPANYIPVVIGEFGPAQGYMTLDDTKLLMARAEELEVPYLAWSFSPECEPGLISTVSNVADCGEGIPLTPSDWGKALKARLATPW